MFVSSQSGSALFYILIAVALFAALGFAFSQSMSSSSSNLTDEEARVYAQDVLSYANRLSRGVQRVMSRSGCSENDISFYLTTNTLLAGYEHTPEVADECKVFHEDGGSITWLTAPEGVNDGSDWIFTGFNKVRGIGGEDTGTGNDLVAILPYINPKICFEINELVSVENTNNIPPIETSNVSTGLFIGTYGSGNDIRTANNEVRGKNSGCFEATGFGNVPNPDTYHFYHVLVAR